MSFARGCLSMIGAAALLAGSLPASPQGARPGNLGSSATLTVGSGPHKGQYDFAPTEACVLAAFGDKPPRLSVVMTSRDSSLSINAPNLDPQTASEIQIVLVVADVKPGAARTSTTYEIDTRPDEKLEAFQRAERANRGMTGKASTMVMTRGSHTLISFSGETALGVKLSGEVTCQKL